MIRRFRRETRNKGDIHAERQPLTNEPPLRMPLRGAVQPDASSQHAAPCCVDSSTAFFSSPLSRGSPTLHFRSSLVLRFSVSLARSLHCRRPPPSQ